MRFVVMFDLSQEIEFSLSTYNEGNHYLLISITDAVVF